MGRNWWHCCVPLRRSTMCIGLVDVALGALVVLGLSLEDAYVKEPQQHEPHTFHYESAFGSYKSGKENHPYEDKYYRTVAIIVLVLSVLQILMGIVLFFGGLKSEKKLCMLWIVINILTLVFMWCFPVRIYGLIVVYMYYQELENQQRVGYSTGGITMATIPHILTAGSPNRYRWTSSGLNRSAGNFGTGYPQTHTGAPVTSQATTDKNEMQLKVNGHGSHFQNMQITDDPPPPYSMA